MFYILKFQSTERDFVLLFKEIKKKLPLVICETMVGDNTKVSLNI